MQKKEGITPVSGASEKFLRSHLLECWKTPFLNVEQTLHSSKSIPKVILLFSFIHLVLYIKYCSWDHISSCYWKM